LRRVRLIHYHPGTIRRQRSHYRFCGPHNKGNLSKCGSLHLSFRRWKDGLPLFDAYREQVAVGQSPLPAGKVKVVVDFNYHGTAGELGKPATVTLSVNGAKVATSELKRTVPIQFSLGEGMDIGEDVGSAVDLSYKLPFKFTGKIEKVTYELK
jgi:hypothetical protein